MSINRRKFIQDITIGSTIMLGYSFPMRAFVDDPNLVHLTILHTNDVHSRIDPFPMDGGKNQGLGGAAKRATIIKKVREENKNVLLLDSGDIFQGTPYFNFFGGELEMKLMSAMKYDAATMGNHDFDSGIEGFYNQLPHANFTIVNANYDFSDTILHNSVKPYKVFNKSGIKIGVFGIGIELKGLVPPNLYKNTIYNDPITTSQNIANHLRNEEKCDFIICLSHLGYKYEESKVSDVILAKSTSGIDLILGGHTHTFLNEPVRIENNVKKPVLISQVGWAGIVLGRLDIIFERNAKDKCVTCKNLLIG